MWNWQSNRSYSPASSWQPPRQNHCSLLAGFVTLSPQSTSSSIFSWHSLTVFQVLFLFQRWSNPCPESNGGVKVHNLLTSWLLGNTWFFLPLPLWAEKGSMLLFPWTVWRMALPGAGLWSGPTLTAVLQYRAGGSKGHSPRFHMAGPVYCQ